MKGAECLLPCDFSQVFCSITKENVYSFFCFNGAEDDAVPQVTSDTALKNVFSLRPVTSDNERTSKVQ